jgi:hypothetical protein
MADILALTERLEKTEAGLRHIRLPVTTEIEVSLGHKQYISGIRTLLRPHHSRRTETVPLELIEKVNSGSRVPAITGLTVHAPEILAAFRTALKDYPGLNLGSTPFTLDAPFTPLVVRHEEIEDYVESPERTSRERQILAYLRCFVMLILRHEIIMFHEIRSTARISYDRLWALFVPGQIICHSGSTPVQCFRVKSVSRSSSTSRQEPEQDSSKGASSSCTIKGTRSPPRSYCDLN